jgi:hypothetical protein
MKHFLEETKSDEVQESFADTKTNYLLHFVEILLDGVYLFTIALYKMRSNSNYLVTTYVSICAACLMSKSWNLYSKYSDLKKIEETTSYE